MTKPGIDNKPSPMTAWFRWPLASAALGVLLERGDRKHRDVDDKEQGLIPIEPHYDWRYSYRKMGRHMVRFAAGEWLDPEMLVPHPVCILWHANNACESLLKSGGYIAEEFMEEEQEEEEEKE